LVCPYFLNVEVKMVHMLLISWAGEYARKNFVQATGAGFGCGNERDSYEVVVVVE
jgi:hypothetical protein